MLDELLAPPAASHDTVDDAEVVLDVRQELAIGRMIGALDADYARLERGRVLV